jgi:hypothetical protein
MKKSRHWKLTATKKPAKKPQQPLRVCGECGRLTGDVYQRCPITGRRTCAVWCRDCYERASVRSRRVELDPEDVVLARRGEIREFAPTTKRGRPPQKKAA